MNRPPPEARYELDLADGVRWEIAAGDGEAAEIVSRLGEAMGLRRATGGGGPSRRGNLCRLLVRVEERRTAADPYVQSASENDGRVVCILNSCAHWGGPYVNLVRLSLIFAREAQTRGGVLIHGALAELDGRGVILAAPGGGGKSTASRRLPVPWRALADDTTLVVRDPRGNYRAHPWPTWSRFLDEGPGGVWDVPGSVPLRGIFFLTRAARDRAERVGPGQAVGLLGRFAGQVSSYMKPGLDRDKIRALNLERFNNLCSLVRDVPAHSLQVSLTGAFWQEIERALPGE